MLDFLLIHTDILKLSKKPATNEEDNEKPNEKITNYCNFDSSCSLHSLERFVFLVISRFTTVIMTLL